MELSELQPFSQTIFKKKYMINGEASPKDVFEGIADLVSSVEENNLKQKYFKEFLEILESTKFLPGGRILANGRKYSKIKNLNNCFTIDIKDDIDDIYKALSEDMKISRVGGGVGIDMTPIRPAGTLLATGGEAAGPLNFLKIFDASAKVISTSGQRRAAHICLLDLSHPDIENFIDIKDGDKSNNLTQFNISVKITDDFMSRLEEDETKYYVRIYNKTADYKNLVQTIVLSKEEVEDLLRDKLSDLTV